MNSVGSLMKLAPVLKSWPRPPMPATFHEKSLRNCHFFCCVCCGVFGFCPTVTPFGKIWYGSRLFAVIALLKSAYWKMNSLSRDPPSTQLWLTLMELKLFLLSPQLLTGAVGPAPYGCELVFRP